jgi:hypothetical protein|tara:strand:+ start:378 stop:887 length:510 start_codon:yes stop_codon:yes gene_type:complete
MTIHNLEISTAHFTNNERTEIEVMLFAEESTEDAVVLIPYNIEAKDGDADYNWLVSKIDIDMVHENTFNKFRKENEQYKENIVAVGKEMGLIFDDVGVDTNLYDELVETLFAPFVEEDMKEKLFLMKLKLFDMDAIKSSKNRELKAKLRKSKDFMSAIKYATMITLPEE